MEKQFLTEETYKKGNRLFKTISLLVLIFGILVGGGLIALGAVKQNEANQINNERKVAAETEVNQKVDVAKARIAEIGDSMTSLKTEYETKQVECDSFDMADSDWYTKVNTCLREASAINSQITELETEKFRLENSNYDTFYTTIGVEYYVTYYFAGGIVLALACVTSLVLYFVTKRRAMMAYSVQTHLPIMKEGVADITSTVAQSAGTIAGSVAKGIKEGLNEPEKKR